MDREFLQLEHTIGAYKARAFRALEALQIGDWEAFELAMRWKRAAFHHFRALDHILEGRHPGYINEAHWQAHWESMQSADRDLAHEIELHQSKLNQQLVRIRSHRSALGKFQSGVKEFAGFQETV